MATSIFFRPPSNEVVQELKSRANGTSSVRYATTSGGFARNNPSYAIIYGINKYGKRVPLMGLGNDTKVRSELKKNTERDIIRKINGNEFAIYGPDNIKVTDAGKYGTLKGITFSFELGGIFSGKYRLKYDQDFSYIENYLAIGNYIIVDYGFIKGTNPATHRAPDTTKRFYITVTDPTGKNKQQIQVSDAEPGLLFRITKPEFTIGDDGKVKFSVQGVGAGTEALSLNIGQQLFFGTPRDGQGEAKVATWVYSTPHRTGNQTQPEYPLRVVKDFEKDITTDVKSLIDFIDWETQYYYSYGGNDAGITSGDYEIWNGWSFVGRKPPAVDPTGDYSKAGFVTFRWDADIYENKYNLPDSDYGWTHVTYVTLQHICWILNNGLNAPNRRGTEYTGDAIDYIFKCDGEYTTGSPFIMLKQGELRGDEFEDRVNRNNLADANKEIKMHIPSADPITCLFSYYDKGKITKNFGTADYLPGYELNGRIKFQDYLNDDPGIYFHSEASEGKTVVADPVSIPVKDRKVQQTLSMAGGDLSGILINRDVLKAVWNELSGLNQTEEGGQGDDVSTITTQKFFNKIFNLIKNCSGGMYDLKLITDPDNTDPTRIVTLIINNNELLPDDPIKMPVLKKGDGNTLGLSLKSKIPQASQAAAFVGNTEGPVNEGGGDYARAKTEEEVIEGEDFTPADQPTVYDIIRLKMESVKKEFAPDIAQTFQGTLAKAITKMKPKEKVTNFLNLFPLELTVKMLGIQGFRFGDTISTAHLPPKYRTARGAARICFTITQIEHSFFKEGWQTDLKTQCRMVPQYLLSPEDLVATTYDDTDEFSFGGAFDPATTADAGLDELYKQQYEQAVKESKESLADPLPPPRQDPPTSTVERIGRNVQSRPFSPVNKM